ncbi:esterase/lipase [Oceanobacter sp. RED65]|uniref:Esterase/lipase n=2 Tax=Bermanella marisrubri TaxID=207949 RepID=Q1N4R8_9GAMM|nr:esterase/lipase [Oceanobacter sp. RED65] [Bermanella marisrubri]
MLFQSLFVESKFPHKLHLMHISQTGHESTPVVLMVHGMVEDGRIFYHKSGKGLVCFLVGQGYQVFVLDLRGMGLSTPKVSAASDHGQTETITEDIPLVMDYILEKTGQARLHIAAHSWGGVNVNALLLRYSERVKQVASCVYFGSKRTVRVRNFDRYLKIDLVWKHLSTRIAERKGYLPAVKYKIGSQNETLKAHRQCVEWVSRSSWIDSDDGFNYGAASQTNSLPPTLYFAAIKDFSLGHRHDVKRFMAESGLGVKQYQLLGRKMGNRLDYDHINMLTAPECSKDHFPNVVQWFAKYL